MKEQMLDENIRRQVKELFAGFIEPVEILFFGSEDRERCPYCEDTSQLLGEVAGLSEMLAMQIFDIDHDTELAQQYHVDSVPSFVIAGRNGDELVDYGVRYKGIPAGHEFSSLVNDLVLVSKRDSGLSDEVREYLASLKEPVHLQVFVTPTWPYCPRAVVLAHQMAMESPMVQAEAVEAMEFPDLANRFDVNGVPQTTINQGLANVVGAVPERQLIEHIRQALDSQ